MKNRQLMFFTVLDDIKPIVEGIETIVEMQYYKTGLMDSQNIPNYSSIADVPNAGVALSGDWNKVDSYLVVKRQTSLNIREVPQRTGEKKFAVDQLVNPKSIELKIGGFYKENIIVAGRIATTSDEDSSSELFKLFSSKVKKEFKKIGSFYVSRKAEENLLLGWRLVTNDKSPKEYDLSLS